MMALCTWVSLSVLLEHYLHGSRMSGPQWSFLPEGFSAAMKRSNFMNLRSLGFRVSMNSLSLVHLPVASFSFFPSLVHPLLICLLCHLHVLQLEADLTPLLLERFLRKASPFILAVIRLQMLLRSSTLAEFDNVLNALCKLVMSCHACKMSQAECKQCESFCFWMQGAAPMSSAHVAHVGQHIPSRRFSIDSVFCISSRSFADLHLQHRVIPTNTSHGPSRR